ncbi:MAG: CpsD/CapB family tyrosine-protein kinase [Pseudomonadota bacterium]
MDRLQHAIAQARAARQAVLARAAAADPAPAPATEAAAAPAADDGARWNALQVFTPSDDVLATNLVVTQKGGPEAAPFDVLRTRAIQQMGQKDWTSLAVTSPDPGCGKSTVTMNLAFSLARLEDRRIVVVDLDLRRPALANLLGFAGDHSVCRVLQGQSDVADQMIRVSPNLAFLTTAKPVRTPSELLQGGRLTKMLDRIRHDYAPDILLFDLPPLMVSDDALAFLPLVDCALMVAAAEQSTLRQVDNCEKEIATQTAMLGVVLNRCAHPGPRYGYGYGSY